MASSFRSLMYLPDSPRTVDEIFRDYNGRRSGLIRALTHDVDEVYALCDPGKDNLCLYGYPDERWEVTLPSERVPPQIPDPTLGINFSRNGMSRRDWLDDVAVHSDAWMHLFNAMNSQPNVFEAVQEWKPVQNTHRKDESGEASGSKSKDKSGEASGSKSRTTVQRASDGQSQSTSNRVEESDAENEEHEETHCGSCGEVYSEDVDDEFWIGCDFCQLWYHGECVSVTPPMADKIDKYECPFCALKRTKP